MLGLSKIQVVKSEDLFTRFMSAVDELTWILVEARKYQDGLLFYNWDGNSRIRKKKHIIFMSKPKLNDEEITQRGRKLYQNIIRPKVETPENIGKIISMNVETGEYEIDDDLLITTVRLRSKQADAALWTERIGFNAVYAVGGTLVRIAP